MRSSKIKKLCSSSLWTCLHHMVILRSQNKITDFLMILAWASAFKPKDTESPKTPTPKFSPRKAALPLGKRKLHTPACLIAPKRKRSTLTIPCNPIKNNPIKPAEPEITPPQSEIEIHVTEELQEEFRPNSEVVKSTEQDKPSKVVEGPSEVIEPSHVVKPDMPTAKNNIICSDSSSDSSSDYSSSSSDSSRKRRKSKPVGLSNPIQINIDLPSQVITKSLEPLVKATTELCGHVKSLARQQEGTKDVLREILHCLRGSQPVPPQRPPVPSFRNNNYHPY